MNILITGASSGIMKHVIYEYLKYEYIHIYVTVENSKQLKIVKRLYQNINSITCFKMDITKINDRNKITKLDIDVLICNAATGYGGSLAEIDINLIRNNYEVNVFSSLELVQLALVNMILKKSGRIIFISSLASIIPIPFLGSYCSSKSSLNMIANTLRSELKLLEGNYFISIIEPGLYYTGFNQVMTEFKYDSMNIDTYFDSILKFLEKYETNIYHLLETNNFNDVVRKIKHATISNNPKRVYRTRLSQTLIAKLHQIFLQ